MATRGRRPELDTERIERFELRLHTTERAELEAAAKIMDRPLGAWVRAIALAEARAKLREAGATAVPAEPAAPPVRVCWEYSTVTMCDTGGEGSRAWSTPAVDNDLLDTWGAAGWELVSVVALSERCVATFKRRIL